MIGSRAYVGWLFLRADGALRPVLITLCMAPVVALALVAVAVAQLPLHPTEVGSNLLTDPGVRGGYVFALALVCIGPLALLHQVLRLGTNSRERRLAALRIAGASPADVRALSAVEVGLPALLGAVLGVPLYAALREWSAGVGLDQSGDGAYTVMQFKVIPASVVPSWWQVVLVVSLAAAAATWIGARGVERVVATPLEVSHDLTTKPPRPWSALLLPLAGVIGFLGFDAGASQVVGSVVVLLIVIALLGLGPTVAYAMGRLAQKRAQGAASLLAAQRLVTDPRASGRAAATAAVISFTIGVCAWMLADLQRSGNGWDPIYVVPVILVLGVVVGSLFLLAVSLGVHQAELVQARSRAFAALNAQGVDADVLIAAHRREAALVVMPLSLAGVVIGSIPSNLIAGFNVWAAIFAPLSILAAGTMSWVAVLLATALVRPAILRSCDPINLQNG